MYYLYKKAKGNSLPNFSYTFKKFEEFYNVANVLTVPLVGTYNINVKSDSYDDVKQFINISYTYQYLVIYIEVSENLLEYIVMHIPKVQLLDSKSNYELFKELVEKYGILFKKGCLKTLYFAIGHTYEEMTEALEQIKYTFPDVREISDTELNELFVIDKLIYPRSICIAYIRLDRGRKTQLTKCVGYFGNDLVLFAMRKAAKKFLEEKIQYYKTGKGSNLIKTMPMENIIKMNMALMYKRSSFMDIYTIMSLYEKGVYVDDFIQRKTVSSSDEEYYSLRRG